MKLLLPDNIYARIFSYLIPGLGNASINFTSSAVISKELDEGGADIALIPSMDLLSYPSFFISGKGAVSFDGPLSNSFFYFIKNIHMAEELYLRGDVSKNEVILSKIIFAEQFGTDVQIFLDSKPLERNSRNYLICGKDNFENGLFQDGLSLADQISDMLDAPYVNYVLASKNNSLLSELNSGLGNADKMLEDNFDKILEKTGIEPEIKEFVRQNLNSVYFDMTEVEKKSLTDLVRMPYFTGLVEDIEELKLIG